MNECKGRKQINDNPCMNGTYGAIFIYGHNS